MPTFTVTTTLLLSFLALTILVVCLVPLREAFPRTTASAGLLWLITLSSWLLSHTVILAANGQAMAVNLSRHFINISTFTYTERPSLFIISILFYASVAIALIFSSLRRLIPIIRGRGVWP